MIQCFCGLFCFSSSGLAALGKDNNQWNHGRKSFISLSTNSAVWKPKSSSTQALVIITILLLPRHTRSIQVCHCQDVTCYYRSSTEGCMEPFSSILWHIQELMTSNSRKQTFLCKCIVENKDVKVWFLSYCGYQGNSQMIIRQKTTPCKQWIKSN